MKNITIAPIKKSFSFVCENIAADKSISHRSAMFALLSDKPSVIKNFLQGEDTLNSLNIIEQLGAKIKRTGMDLSITPPRFLIEPNDVLYCGNAGTGMRLFCGLLSGFEGSFVLTGDKYLRGRPMNRVVKPLCIIGAHIDGRENGNLAPLHIRGAKLKSFRYESPIDSAQIKSALILAALKADEPSYYKESILSRDHTERMLSGMGANISTDNEGWIKIVPIQHPLAPLHMTIPADPSSGFFFAIAAAIIPDAKITLRNVSLNSTRIEAYRALERMGVSIEYELKENIYEPIGDITVAHQGELRAIDIDSNIAWLIDELPALSIAMSIAKGTSTVRNAKELRVKESDRISTVLKGLNLAGIETKEKDDGYDIVGGALKQATINSHGDHRIAMSFAIAGLLCGMVIEDVVCIDTSFPNFHEILQELKG
ncbi:MAG: 3-phosphoshikimate 1-carboxyvinyltransferase [Sulfurovum sp.]|nr:3-phosphoshikimate 1-carboxyvinyltransferase [Sulfurovum sp.]